jgi:hypothetical protein
MRLTRAILPLLLRAAIGLPQTSEACETDGMFNSTNFSENVRAMGIKIDRKRSLLVDGTSVNATSFGYYLG